MSILQTNDQGSLTKGLRKKRKNSINGDVRDIIIKCNV